MKPYRIDSDIWFIARQQWIAREQDRWRCTEKAVLERWQSSRAIRRAVGWCLLGILATFILLAAVPDYTEDFTDTGVGCLNDCNEPAEPMPGKP